MKKLYDYEYIDKKHTADVYSFYFRPYGWAVFTICEATGEFSIQSDWGNFGYRWNPKYIGTETLHEFIMNTYPDYIVNKLSYDKECSFRNDFLEEETLNNFKQAIISNRLQDIIDKETARKHWDDLICFWEYDVMDNPSPMDMLFQQFPTELEEYYPAYEYVRTGPCPNYIFVRDELLPFFQEYLKRNL